MSHDADTGMMGGHASRDASEAGTSASGSATSRKSSGSTASNGARGTSGAPAPATHATPTPSSTQTIPIQPTERATHYRTGLGRFLVKRGDHCIACGMCEAVCPTGVHVRRPGFQVMELPKSEHCLGTDCAAEEDKCVASCPTAALEVIDDPQHQALGDRRWTGDLLLAGFESARTGRPAESKLETRTGGSGGGFDRIRFQFETLGEHAPVADAPDIDLSLSLNRRDHGRALAISVPMYGGGMSYGSIGLPTMLARAKAARSVGTLFSTGEGGYPPELIPYADQVITQVATGLFGVSEESIKRAPIVEFKYAQGAKPGLGGHLLGDKVTPVVADLRESQPGVSLFSPFPFHSVYSVEDHKKHIDWVRAINPDALISVKVSTPGDVDMVAVGSYYAGANIVHIDGGYGGTGAAPEIAKKNIAMPLEYALPKTHRFLADEGIRDEICLIASGGIRTAYDIAKAIALGADGVVIGTTELVAIDCVRCKNCESHRGCPRGIATTDPELEQIYTSEWAAQRIVNIYNALSIELRSILTALGMTRVSELVGRTDTLRHLDFDATNVA